MDDIQLQKMATFCKAVSHPVRLRIILLLRERELSVGSLLTALGGCSGANVTQHLNVLRRQGIVASRRQGNVVYNRINDPEALALLAALENVFAAV